MRETEGIIIYNAREKMGMGKERGRYGGYMGSTLRVWSSKVTPILRLNLDCPIRI